MNSVPNTPVLNSVSLSGSSNNNNNGNGNAADTSINAGTGLNIVNPPVPLDQAVVAQIQAEDARYNQLSQFLKVVPLPVDYDVLRGKAVADIAQFTDEQIKNYKAPSKCHMILTRVHELNTSEELNNAIADKITELTTESDQALQNDEDPGMANDIAKRLLYHTGALRSSMRFWYNVDQHFPIKAQLCSPDVAQDVGGNLPAAVVATSTKVSAAVIGGVLGTLASVFIELPISILAEISQNATKHLGPVGEFFKDSLEFLTGAHAQNTLDAKLRLAKSPAERVLITMKHTCEYLFVRLPMLALSLLFLIPGALVAFYNSPDKWQMLKTFFFYLGAFVTSPIWLPLLAIKVLILPLLGKAWNWFKNLPWGEWMKAVISVLEKIGDAIASGVGAFFKGYGDLMAWILKKISFGYIDIKDMTAMKGFLMFVATAVLIAAIIATLPEDLAISLGGVSAMTVLWTLQILFDIVIVYLLNKEKKEHAVTKLQVEVADRRHQYLMNALKDMNIDVRIPTDDRIQREIEKEREEAEKAAKLGTSQASSSSLNDDDDDSIVDSNDLVDLFSAPMDGSASSSGSYVMLNDSSDGSNSSTVNRRAVRSNSNDNHND